MPGFGLLASGLVLSALALWFQLQSDKLKSQSDKLKSQSKNVDGNKDESEKKDKVTQSEREKKELVQRIEKKDKESWEQSWTKNVSKKSLKSSGKIESNFFIVKLQFNLA